MKWYQYLIPTYGNWGGPGWSGGKFTDNPSEVDFSIPGVDGMDDAFRIHDQLYQKRFCAQGVADEYLANYLCDINVKGIWPNCYRYACIGIFTVKGKLLWILGAR